MKPGDDACGLKASGVFYIATGERHFAEALASTASLRRQMDLPVTIATDQGGDVPDYVRKVPVQPDRYRGKVWYMKLLPYEKTLYLDTDTFVCRDISDVFRLLDHFEIAGAQDPGRTNWPTESMIPQCFPEFNTGVLLLKKCQEVETLLARWLQLYDRMLNGRIKYQRYGDQGAFREALYSSRARITVLPPEYNFRCDYPACLAGMVKIVHGRGYGDIVDFMDRINKNGRMRLYRPGVGLL